MDTLTLPDPMARDAFPMAVNTSPATHRIRFTSKQFTHSGTPEFPYVASRLTPHGIEYTAVITTHELPQDVLRRNFPDFTIDTSEEGGDFLESDVMAGQHIRGFVPAPAPRSLWRRLFRLQ